MGILSYTVYVTCMYAFGILTIQTQCHVIRTEWLSQK